MTHQAKRPKGEDVRQLGFAFDAPPPRIDKTCGVLAGMDRRISGMIGRVLKEHNDPREVVAARMSALLGDKVSKEMLDQYAAPSSEAHNISAARFFALVLATDRHDLLGSLAKTIGASILVGDEAHAAMLGNAHAKKHAAEEEIAALTQLAKPIVRGVS
jgi:hypothetical protein